jgi:hypothetical protein
MLSIRELNNEFHQDIKRDIDGNLKVIRNQIRVANRSYLNTITYVFQSFVKYPFHKEKELRLECYAGIIKKIIEKGFKVKFNNSTDAPASITISWDKQINSSETIQYLKQYT